MKVNTHRALFSSLDLKEVAKYGFECSVHLVIIIFNQAIQIKDDISTAVIVVTFIPHMERGFMTVTFVYKFSFKENKQFGYY